MQLGKLRIFQPLFTGQGRHIIRNERQFLPGGKGQDLHLGRPLQIIEFVKGFGNTWPHHDHAVVAHKEHTFVGAQQVRDPFPFLIIERHAVVIAIIGNAAIKAAGVLIEHQKFKILETGQRRGVRHVGVQNTAGMG